MREPISEPPRWPPPWWRRIHPRVLAGGLLIAIGAPALFAVALVTSFSWLLTASIASVCLGLFLIVDALIPGRNVLGTKIWQNDGTPGGL
jgi:membrane-bound ClpP family serine protease